MTGPEQTGKPGPVPLCLGLRRFISEAAVAYAGVTGEEPVAELRRVYNSFSDRFRTPRPAGMTVQDLEIEAPHGAVPVRVYEPVDRRTGPRGAACIVYMHGGGWVLGSPDTHDSVTADMAGRTGAVVISIDYRLAPEHPFPAALDDCRAVLSALARDGLGLGIDPNRIVVSGDSAGANLAVASALALSGESDWRLAGQVLVYPVLCSELRFPSYVENARAPMLRTVEMRRYWDLYLAGKSPTRDPLAAPLAADDLSGLPPAVIMTAAHDPVRDDGAEYARRLDALGIPVLYRCAPDLTHGYLRARTMSPSAATEFEWCCDRLKELLVATALPGRVSQEALRTQKTVER